MVKVFIALKFTCALMFFASCVSRYQQNIKALASSRFCLDVERTEKRNNIKIGNGSLVLNENKTFDNKNDSKIFSNIKGEWDLCCDNSWGNYIFKPKNHIRQMSLLPEFEVKIEDKIFILIFTTCE